MNLDTLKGEAIQGLEDGMTEAVIVDLTGEKVDKVVILL